MTMIRHSTEVMRRARELTRDGWLAGEIPSILEREFGAAPNRSTIHRWTSERSAERDRILGRQRRRRAIALAAGGRLRANFKSPELVIERIRALDRLGLSNTAIATVITFDLPDFAVTRHQVAGILNGRRPWAWRNRP